MNYTQTLNNEKDIFWKFMQAKYPLFYNSNLFLRDLQYAILRFFETKSKMLSYTMAESIALDFAKSLEVEGDLLRLDAQTWRVNFVLAKSNKEIKAEVTEE